MDQGGLDRLFFDKNFFYQELQEQKVVVGPENVATS